MSAPRPVTMDDLRPGTKVRHIEWGDTGTIRVIGGTTEFRPDEHLGDIEVSPEGPVFPADLEILGGPRTWTHPDVLTRGVAEGWAEAETDPTRINWAQRQARAAIPFEVVDGRPVNPCESTGIRYGRNEFGHWGEALMADALVTLTYEGGRYLLMIERSDGYGWAVPGGHVEPGETGVQAAVRELAEETGLTLDAAACREMAPRYVPDPRASDEAWAVTVRVHATPSTRYPAAVTGGDDARQAAWMLADDYECLVAELALFYGGTVFAAHVDMLREFLDGTPGGTS